ncbi:translation initiation factor IF-2-like [Phyllostomus hastatus]|uniref:translation initiation factor IF-2-like n=1 Tax=Phyllostomus hastatus TaxID=9423 RepID=UPI001E684F24|nr:translation initiation factor IF-2-like [Phyllostomus hastatus]
MVGAGPASRRAAGRARGALHPRPAGARGGGGRRGCGPRQADPRTSPGGPRAGGAVGRRQWLQWRRQRGASGRSRAPGRRSVLGESGVGSEELRKERSSFRGTLERRAVRHALICIFGSASRPALAPRPSAPPPEGAKPCGSARTPSRWSVLPAGPPTPALATFSPPPPTPATLSQCSHWPASRLRTRGLERGLLQSGRAGRLGGGTVRAPLVTRNRPTQVTARRTPVSPPIAFGMMGGGSEGTGSLRHPGGGVRGSYFHLPGSTPLPCGRRPAWPRVWSPAPRHSASPRGTRIRGAFAANCQESPEGNDCHWTDRPPPRPNVKLRTGGSGAVGSAGSSGAEKKTANYYKNIPRLEQGSSLGIHSILTSIKYLTRQVHVALEGLPVAQVADAPRTRWCEGVRFLEPGSPRG